MRCRLLRSDMAGLSPTWRTHAGSRSQAFSSENLARWRHVDTISVRLFSMLSGSAVAMTIFSVKHTSQRLVPHLYGAARRATSHLTSYGAFSSLRSHTYLESAVSFRQLGLLNEWMCAVYLCLKGPSVSP